MWIFAIVAILLASPESARAEAPIVDFWSQSTGKNIVLDPVQQETFFEFAAAHNLRTLFLEISGIHPLTVDLSQSAPAKALANFLVSAKKHRILVDLHLGRTDEWMGQPAVAEAAIRTVVEYSQSLKSQFGNGIDVHGIHIDVEYGDQSAATRETFVRLLRSLHSITQSAGIPLVVDFDPFNNAPLEIDGVSRSFYAWVLRNADRFAIMEYQNDPSLTIKGDGSNGGVADFVWLASQLNKTIEVGFLVACGTASPQTRSFCGKGEASLGDAMSVVGNAFGHESSFDQFAIFTYGSYGDLKPGSKP